MLIVKADAPVLTSLLKTGDYSKQYIKKVITTEYMACSPVKLTLIKACAEMVWSHSS